MWDNHPFSKSNKITKRTVRVEVRNNEEGGRGVGQNLKKRGEDMQYMGGL